MSETRVAIPSGDVSLEALHDPGIGNDGVVLCHPHPLYGGDMENNVVAALQAVYSRLGRGTLRFNFRGVGRSGGVHGEGDLEADDIVAAAEYLIGKGTEAVHLAGYSYGAWVALKAMQGGFRPRTFVLVSPPLDFLDFAGLTVPSAPCLIVSGDRDSFCAIGSLRRWLASGVPAASPPVVEVLPRCDHFYRGMENLLCEKVSGFLKSFLQG